MIMIVSLRSPNVSRGPTGLAVSGASHAPLSEPVIKKLRACGSAAGKGSVVVVAGSVATELSIEPVDCVAGARSGDFDAAMSSPVFWLLLRNRWPYTRAPEPMKQARAIRTLIVKTAY